MSTNDKPVLIIPNVIARATMVTDYLKGDGNTISRERAVKVLSEMSRDPHTGVLSTMITHEADDWTQKSASQLHNAIVTYAREQLGGYQKMMHMEAAVHRCYQLEFDQALSSALLSSAGIFSPVLADSKAPVAAVPSSSGTTVSSSGATAVAPAATKLDPALKVTTATCATITAAESVPPTAADVKSGFDDVLPTQPYTLYERILADYRRLDDVEKQKLKRHGADLLAHGSLAMIAATSIKSVCKMETTKRVKLDAIDTFLAFIKLLSTDQCGSEDCRAALISNTTASIIACGDM